MGCGCLRSLAAFGFALGYLLFVFPVVALISVVKWVIQMATFSPWIALLLVASVGSPIVAKYHNKVISVAEFGMRCYVEPIWSETLLPIYEGVEILYNHVICWWDAANWAVYGYVNEFLIPLVYQCGVKNIFLTIPPIVRVFFQEFLFGYIATGEFLHGFYDITNLGLACVAFMDAWVDLWCCLCMDLCAVFRCAPIPIIFFIYPPLQISGFLRIQEFYLAVGAAINVSAAVLQIVLRLLIQIFTVGFAGVDPRPDFEVAAFYFCDLAQHFFRALETLLQCFWDSFVPWDFNFTKFLCILDTFVCLVMDLFVIGTRVLINVDKIVFDMFTPNPSTGTGPRPGSIWHSTIKVIAIRFFNTIAPVTDPAFYQDVHVIGRTTFIECLCIAIRRIICDPTDSNTVCFNQGAVDFLKDFDFCCLTNTVLILANDFTKGLYELFLNTTDASAFFLWVDGNPNYAILIGYQGDLVNVVSCILSSLKFIPVVGHCLHGIVVAVFAFVTGMVDFGFRLTLSITTLPYFLIVLNMNNFLLRPLEAVTLFENTVNILTAQTPTSFLNCVCYIHNIFKIPPITTNNQGQFVPCDCQQVGFIPPPETRMSLMDAFDWKDDYLGYQFKRSAINRVTPILQYAVEKEMEARGESVINPIFLKERILENMALYGASMIPDLARDVDAFIAAKVTTMRSKWEQIKQCQAWREETEMIRTKYPWRFRFLEAAGKLPGQKQCAGLEEYLVPVGNLEREREILANDGKQDYLERIDQISGRNATEFDRLGFNGFAKTQKQGGNSTAGGGGGGGGGGERLQTDPPEPTVYGCPGPGEPLVQCFDMCCLARASILIGGHILQMLARLINAFIQGNFQNPSWSYFTASATSNSPSACPKCFEQDLTTLIVYAIRPLVCLCRFQNLIAPSSPMFPRPDLCCAIALIADFVACQIQVVINGIKSLALDAPRFSYFVDGQFLRDADMLFDITLGIVACLCNIVRYVLPVRQLTGGGLDPCCLAENVMLVLVEFQRLLLQIIVNIPLAATGRASGLAYWRDPGVSRGYAIIDNIGFVKQGDVVINAIFGRKGGICASAQADQGVGGISQCVCQILSTIIPIRPQPGLPISDPGNCPIFDICCVIRGISFFAGEWTKFQLRVLASTWQSWTPEDYGRPPGNASPIAFLEFLFCNEDDPIGQPACGKLKPTLNAFLDALVNCPCQFGRLADAWLTMVLPAHNFQCFCGQTDGFFTNVGTLIESITLAIVTLIRRIADPTYWSFTQGGPSTNAVTDSWAFRFLGPTINAVCNLVTSVLCVTNSIIGLPCTELQKRIVRSVVRWIAEVVLRALAFFQGFILIFAAGHTDPCVEGQSGCPEDATVPTVGVSVAQLAQVFVALASFPLDMLFGDSSVLCSVINPPRCSIAQGACCCYSPLGSYKEQPIGGIFSAENRCGQCLNNDCSLILNSYAFPTCSNDPCDFIACGSDCQLDPALPDYGCFKKKPCVNVNLVSCDVNNPFLAPLDGIVIAVLRYMRCMIAVIFQHSGIEKLFDAIISLFSFIWQIFAPILRFIAAMVLFIFLIFFFISGGCGCWGGNTGSYVQRGALCYPCEENPNIRTGPNRWWADTMTMHNPAVDPRPNATYHYQGDLCLAGYDYTRGDFLNATNVRVIDNKCIDISLRDGPNGCAPGCTVGLGPGQCQVCNWHGNNQGEVGNSIDCDAFGGGSCTLCGANPLVLCGILQLWNAFGDIFRSFIQIFQQAPINPTTPPSVKRDPRATSGRNAWRRFHNSQAQRASRVSFAQFKRRAEYETTRGVYEGATAIELMFAAAWDYDISDCTDDLRECVCRNFILTPEACQTDHPELKKRFEERDPRVVDEMTMPVINEMAGMCNHTTTRCDYLIHQCGNMTWSQVTLAQKVEYVDCLDRMIQGSRINVMLPSFPTDYFYTNTGPLTLIQNLQEDASAALRKSKRDYAEQAAFRQEQMSRGSASGQRRDDTYAHKWEGEAVSRDEWDRRQILSRRQRILKEMKSDVRWKDSMIAPFFVEFDQHEYRLRTGSYTTLIRDAWYNIKYGTVSIPFYAVWDAFKDQTVQAASGLYQVQLRKTLDSAYRGAGAVFTLIDMVATKGPMQMYRDARKTIYDLPENKANRNRAEEIRELTRQAFYQGPLYKWWNSTQSMYDTMVPDFRNPFGVFFNHLRTTFHWQRANWKTQPPSGFTLDLHMQENVITAISKRWEMKWTPQKLANWESVGRIFYRLKNAFAPHTMTEETRGFLINGNCKIIDGIIDEIIFLVSYCANDFVINYPLTRRRELSETSASWRWFESMAERGEYLYGDKTGRQYIPEDQEKATRAFEHLEQQKAKRGQPKSDFLDWAIFRGLNWVRPKIRPVEDPIIRERRTLLQHVTRQQWLKAVVAAPFDVTDWLMSIIDSVFSTNLGMELTMFAADFETWATNDNLDYMAGPVGLKYWALFWVRCQFKPAPGQLASNAALNLSCKVGTGLETALGWVIFISVIVFVIGSIVFPATMMPLIAISAAGFFLVVMPAVAWHYSPRCWLMTPSLTIPGVTGLSMPYTGFNMAFPALPFCAMTEVRHLANKYITKCYRVLWGTHLEFLFPPFMIPGDPCPPCPQRVYIDNCEDLGLGNGVANTIYALHYIWPGSRMLAKELASLWIFNQGGLPQEWANATVGIFDQFANPTADQRDQFNWCFGVTLLSLAGIGILLIIGVTFAFMLFSVGRKGARAAWNVVAASPLAYMVPGSSTSAYEQIIGDKDDNGRDDPRDAYIGIQFSDEIDEETGRRKRYPTLDDAVEEERLLRRQRQAHFFGWIDNVSLSFVDGIGHAFKAIKRD